MANALIAGRVPGTGSAPATNVAAAAITSGPERSRHHSNATGLLNDGGKRIGRFAIHCFARGGDGAH